MMQSSISKRILTIILFIILFTSALVVLSSCEHTHSFGLWTIVVEATCAEEGIKEQVCKCGAKQTEAIIPVGHNFVDHVCKKCGQKEEETDGLEYILNEAGDGFLLAGIGKVTASKIVIPSKYRGLPVTGISNKALYSQDSVTEIILPETLTSIGNGAFAGLILLTDITINNNVTSIGEGAFIYCFELTHINIPANVTSIGIGAFSFCCFLNEITVDENNPAYISVDGNLYSKDKTVLMQYAIGKQDREYKILDGVQRISSGAFAINISLASVFIPDTVKKIDNMAFFESAGLRDVYYGGTEEQWKSVLIGGGNKYLTSANIHFSAK